MSDFDLFYSLYPRKVAKLEAVKAWKQMTRDYEPAEIIDGLRRCLPSLSRRERQYIPHPASWLRAGRWMDEVEVVSTGRRQNYADAIINGMMKQAHGPADIHDDAPDHRRPLQLVSSR